MIEPLDLSDRATAAEVLSVQRAAHQVNAELTGIDGLALLHESLAELIAAPLEWKGIREDGRLVAAIAVTGSGHRCDVERLIVDPSARGGGLDRRLVQAVLMHRAVTASTAEANLPAISLYEGLGFRRCGRREIAPGVWTVQFEHWSDHLKTSFDTDVDGYESARPGYPDALFAMLAEQCGLGIGCRVLEIGPGTGQATLPLLRLGAHVTAVEPGPRMAARLRERVAGSDCQVVESDFERADIAGPFDLAVAATSFHWVDPATGIVKLAGLLPRDAWLAVWWNVFGDVGPHEEAFAALLRPIARRFQTEERMSSLPHALDDDARRAEIEAGAHFAIERVETYELPVAHDGASLRALFASFSDWTTLPEPDRTRALDDVAAIVDQHFGGQIERRYLTRLYVARRR